MVPQTDWTQLPFGIEIEFVGAPRGRLELLPGWTLVSEDDLYLEDGTRARGDDPQTPGGELASPILTWADRDQIRELCRRLAAIGARANFSCGLHVHASAAPWGGPAALVPILEAALATEDALRELLHTAEHRTRATLPTRPHMLAVARLDGRCPSYGERPASRRGGINARALFDHGSVELRLPNGSVDPAEIEATVALWLKWMVAVGAGHTLPGTAAELAAALEVPTTGYPPPAPVPPWRWRELWLDEALYPALLPHCRDWGQQRYPGSEKPPGIVWIEAAPDGGVWAETETGRASDHLRFRWENGAWRLAEVRHLKDQGPASEG